LSFFHQSLIFICVQLAFQTEEAPFAALRITVKLRMIELSVWWRQFALYRIQRCSSHFVRYW